MALGECIPDLIASGAVSRETGVAMQSLYDDLARDYRRQFGEQAAADMASTDVLASLEREALRKKRQSLLQVRAQNQALINMRRYDNGAHGDGPLPPRAAEALFDRDGRAPYGNVEGRRKAVKGQAHAMMAGILNQHRRNLAGVIREKAELGDITRELFGEATGNVNARELADAWERTSEWMRQRFNAAGGNIAKLERWGLPQSHDTRAVRRAGYQAWRDVVTPLLDRSRMIDERTGKPFTPESMELALREVFETIRTDGWSKRQAGSATGAKSLANRHAEHRFLQFRDADGWSSYAEQFGGGSAFDAMLGHVEAMARDIALVEVLGPNPAATVRWLKDTVERQAALDTTPNSKATDRAHGGAARVQRLYDEITGANRQPENRAIALGFSSLRSIQTSAKLGSATLSAVTDVGFQAATRRFNGLPVAGALTDYVKLLNPANAEDRLFAVRAGLIAEEWGNMASAQARYLNEELTGEVSKRLAEATLRLSGLSAWTQAGRWAFGMEFLGHLTHERGKGWDALDPAFRAALGRYGFNAGRWDTLRASQTIDHKGTPWILPESIPDQALADQVLEMVLSETDFAVPTADLTTRSIFNSGAKRGTIFGEVTRSALLFKSFGISILLTHGRRMLEQQGGWNRARYAAGLTIALTIGGALSLDSKEISKGRDPLPKADPAFWGKAMLQGGGFGIFGDFINASENRFGGGLASTLGGPLVQTASNVGYLVRDTAMSQLSRSEKDRASAGHTARRDVLTLLKQEVPIASSLWWTRAAYERLMLDELEQMIDPDYRKHFKRLEKKAEERGSGYFWAPGETAPARAPDFSNALEGAPE